MYRGFDLQLNLAYDDSLYQYGHSIYRTQKSIIETDLQKFISNRNTIDGSKLQEEWFPSIKADIFISHSHKDEYSAIMLAGWLHQNFKLNSFIDSCIWGYSGDLLRILDNQYCRNLDGQTFDYEKRNRSTSHVHMMLSTALSKMIDKTECIIFLNTPNSISVTDTINTTTTSPWIYAELVMTKLIKKTKPNRRNLVYFNEGGTMSGIGDIEYQVDMHHLSKITDDSLKLWQVSYRQQFFIKQQTQIAHPLDVLYNLIPYEGKTP